MCIVLCNFITGVDSCRHHPNQDITILSQQNISLVLPFYNHVHVPPLRAIFNLAITNLLPVAIILLFLGYSVNGITQ